ncbi:MAG TPA: glycosyltransferase family 2 protein [Rhizomicrobium sp.]
MGDPSDSRPAHPLISVVVPCYNEEAVIGVTHPRLSAAMAALPVDYELVYVSDGSRDRTLGLLRDIQKADPHVRVVGFSRNFGHQIAVTAGVDHAKGDAIAIIDADLQDPPELIGDMIAKWREGYDVVYGKRISRAGESAFKLATARWFYRLLNRLSDTVIPLDTGDFRLIDRQVADAMREMPEHDRFLRGMVAWLGFRQYALPYSRDARVAGETKYPLRRMIAFATDGILSFSISPLRVAVWLGVITAGFAIVGIVYALFIRLFSHEWVSGWASLLFAILLMGGVQLIMLGIVGEYVGRIYREGKKRPLYLVRERFGFDDNNG